MEQKPIPLPPAILRAFDAAWGQRAHAVPGPDTFTNGTVAGIREVYDWLLQWYANTHGEPYVPLLYSRPTEAAASDQATGSPGAHSGTSFTAERGTR
jgi:hypothetical protein